MTGTKKSLFLFLVLPAVILRLAVAAFFFHPDIKSQHFHAQFFGRGVIDIYGYISDNLRALPYKDTFNYPPLAYFLLGGWDRAAGLIVGQADFSAWLNDWGPLGYRSLKMFDYLLVLKIPYLLLDIAVAFLLTRLVQNPKLKEPLLAFWLFNPVSLYAVYMLSQFDIICAFLTVLVLLFVQKGKFLRSAFLLGLGAAVKSYPLLLFPFLLFRTKNLRSAGLAVLVFLVGLIGPMLPVLGSKDYRYTMTHSNLMQSIFITGLDVSATQKIPFYVLIYAFVLLYSWLTKSRSNILPEFFTVTILVILLSNFHAQWIIWSWPFAALIWVKTYKKYWPLFLVFIIGFFGTNWLIPDLYALPGLFSPINPQVLLLPSLFEMVRTVTDPVIVQSVFRAMLVSSGFGLIYLAWKSYDAV